MKMYYRRTMKVFSLETSMSVKAEAFRDVDSH